MALAVGSVLVAVVLFAGVMVVSFDLLHSDKATEGRSSLAPVRITGAEETVFSWARDRCADEDIPDLPARAFKDESGQVHLITAHFTGRQFVGPTLDRLRHPCDVLMSSADDPNPARFNDHEWLAAPYSPDGRTVYALVHNEYHGYEHPGRCPSGDYLKCWYNAVTLAVSRDGGASFRDARPPPGHLVATTPYRYVPDAGPYGIFSPSNIVRKEDGHYYTIVLAQSYGRQQLGSCLLRTQRLDLPSSWRAWNGSEFETVMPSPYEPGLGSPGEHICETVSKPEIGNMHESLTYNTYLDKYLLVGLSGSQVPGRRGVTWGIYYSTSDDLVDWSTRKLIREVELPWTYKCGDLNPILYPSVLDPESTSRNFETTGRRPYMYFTRFHYRDCVQTLNRDLVRVRLSFSR